jgi:eukaryotic-like serine/threonine-protein kinase
VTLAAGYRIAQYEVIGPIGSGGMGEVYRARDARLGREVAIKVLPASFAVDADHLRRFEQVSAVTQNPASAVPSACRHATGLQL